MNFVKDSFKYCFKNFFNLLVFVLPISVLAGFLNPYRTVTFLQNYKSQNISTYWDMMQSTISPSWIYLLWVVVALVLFVFTVSLMLSGMEYHMRTGKFSFGMAFKRCRYYLLPVISLFLIFIIFTLVLFFLMPAINYFVHYMLSGLRNPPTNATYFICVIVYCLGYLFAFMFLVVIMVAVNLIALNGYGVKSALSNSISLLENKFFKYLFTLLLPYVFIIPIVLLCGKFSFYPFLSIILFAIQMIFSLSLCMISYFKFTGTVRKDDVKGYFLKGVK